MNNLPPPTALRELSNLWKLRHYLGCLLLRPTMLAAEAKESGFVPLSKTFRVRYLNQCQELRQLKRETEQQFDIAIVREKNGVSLWKRSCKRPTNKSAPNVAEPKFQSSGPAGQRPRKGKAAKSAKAR